MSAVGNADGILARIPDQHLSARNRPTGFGRTGAGTSSDVFAAPTPRRLTSDSPQVLSLVHVVTLILDRRVNPVKKQKDSCNQLCVVDKPETRLEAKCQ